MLRESREAGNVKGASKAHPQRSRPGSRETRRSFCVRGACMSFGRRNSGLGVSPLKKCRAVSAPKAERSNIPRWHFLSLLLLLFSVNSVWAVDPSRHISQYGHSAWRVQDGVFSGSPNAIAQTTDGYLWIGTQGGLLRFDGVRFVPWAPPDGQYLPSSNVTSLLGARDGSLWIGMEGGLSRWDKRDLTSYLIGPTRINSIIEDRNGTVWFVRSRGSAEAGGLCQIIGTGMRCYGKADGLPGSNVATALVEDGLGNLWTGSDTAVVRWKPDT